MMPGRLQDRGGPLAPVLVSRYLELGGETPEQGGSMARKLGMRTAALASLFGGGAAVVVLVHNTLNMTW